MNPFFKTLPSLVAALFSLSHQAMANAIEFPQYGFQIDALDAPASEQPASALIMFLPPSDGFSPNINIQIQPYTGTIKEYADLSKGQFSKMNWKVLSESQPAENEWVVEYEGTTTGRDLHFLARAVAKEGKVYLVTATAAKSQWESVQETLKKHVQSFQKK